MMNAYCGAWAIWVVMSMRVAVLAVGIETVDLVSAVVRRYKMTKMTPTPPVVCPESMRVMVTV